MGWPILGKLQTRRSAPSGETERELLLDIAFGENGYYFSVRPLTTIPHTFDAFLGTDTISRLTDAV